MKTLSAIFLYIAFATVSFAQTEEAAVKATLENYMSGIRSRAEQAFHPSATMKFVHYQTGEFKDMPIADYLARLPETASSSGDEWKREIESINVEGTAAQAKIKIDAGKMKIYDYMNLLKINGQWKIVSKIFYRKDL